MLSKGPTKTIKTENVKQIHNEIQKPKPKKRLANPIQNQPAENKDSQLMEKLSQLEKEIHQLKQENSQLKAKNLETNEEVDRLKGFLFALKEKKTDITFINLNDYQEGSLIGEGATSSVKIFIKTEQEKYAKKELKQFTHKILQRFLTEGEVLFRLRHPCIIRIIGVNYGDDTHAPSIVLSLEPNSLEKAIKNKELDNKQKNRITTELVLGMR